MLNLFQHPGKRREPNTEAPVGGVHPKMKADHDNWRA